ncbi:DUF1592 domain-containing protein [Aureliella helgolandensis]|nr:DUF1592 domain-containing protein [Aureliella helgolandensis]
MNSQKSAWIVFLLVGVAFPLDAVAQPGKQNDPLSWDRNVRGLFGRYCLDCHRGRDPSANVDLAVDENPLHILEHRKKWRAVLEVLQAGQMPPEDERQPSQEMRQQMIDFLEVTLNSIDCGQVEDPGKPVLRRLNRVEYDNALEDLTGLDLSLADDFPPDPVGYGFDNIADVLTLTPAQIEMYHSAAVKATQAIVEARRSNTRIDPILFGSIGTERGKEETWSGEKSPSTPQEGAHVRELAREGISNFAFRAFRRPPDEYYINRLMRIYDRAIQEDQSHAEAMNYCLQAVLISPNFLFRIEADRPNESQAYRVDDFELASRLSYLIWSRAPDRELLQLAQEGQLQVRATLLAQIERMLADSRSKSLVSNFFFQWLDLRLLDSHQPSPSEFGDFSEALRDSMRGEVEALLHAIVRDEAPLTAIIDHDALYVDRRLSAYYGLQPVDSETPVRVSAPDRRRGGLLTTAALLMVQADPGRTNIPRRGSFVAGQLLGAPPPPPPPDVPELVVVDDGQQRSLREIFELHRSSPACQNCHLTIDPIGFALENYDAIGRWRDEDGGAPIDPAGELPDGVQLEDIRSLKDFLLSEQEQLLRTMASKLLTYALGRGLSAPDDCVVEKMVEAAQAEEASFSAMLVALVESFPFTHRINPEF